MAKETIPEIKSTPKEVIQKSPETPPPVVESPKMISVPAEDWEAMKKMVADLKAQQTKIIETVAPEKMAQFQQANVAHKEVPNTEPVKEGAVRKKFLVDLPHIKPVIISVDVVPGAEFAVKDQAIAAYNKHFGILRTEHKHDVSELPEAQKAA